MIQAEKNLVDMAKSCRKRATKTSFAVEMSLLFSRKLMGKTNRKTAMAAILFFKMSIKAILSKAINCGINFLPNLVKIRAEILDLCCKLESQSKQTYSLTT